MLADQYLEAERQPKSRLVFSFSGGFLAGGSLAWLACSKLLATTPAQPQLAEFAASGDLLSGCKSRCTATRSGMHGDKEIGWCQNGCKFFNDSKIIGKCESDCVSGMHGGDSQLCCYIGCHEGYEVWRDMR